MKILATEAGFAEGRARSLEDRATGYLGEQSDMRIQVKFRGPGDPIVQCARCHKEVTRYYYQVLGAPFCDLCIDQV